MADYSFTGYYLVTNTGGSNYSITSSYNAMSLAATDGKAEETTFSGSETIVMNGFIFGPLAGSTSDGIIVNVAGQPSPWYITNTSNLANGAPVDGSASSFVTCFLAGTQISTPTGLAAVETLQPGDLVLTADGRVEPVKWLFVQTVSIAFAGDRAAPIRIRAGALGDGLPVRDLLISPDHALLLGDVLVHAGALVGAPGVTRESGMPDAFRYYHVELADHALIIAEGAAAETFVDSVTRRRFDNWRAYEDRFGEQAEVICELDLPRIMSARQLPPALRRQFGLGRKVA